MSLDWQSDYLFRFYFKYKCIDKENIKDGAGIIVGNHQSYLDGFMGYCPDISKEEQTM